MKRRLPKSLLGRKLLLIALISLLLASALQLYTFGLSADFFGRWLRSFFVFFVMIAVTVLAIIPGVNYVVARFIRK
ncbi:DUF2798 domain-containing protein [Pontibacter akesuensis]|uniref:DUF2798 domain-containing protein n=1 Tax=Pontibacter akesuensis TaxID=388950 RepID=A0A1I7JJG8_9BACT|nr:DUF2798 domain-containing protein [Pontibacter akesuensis]GHA69542.1 hypothetical protein GCM10007389_23320 [Pontibacter akesuensis]SFU85297.1 hypothetical protein SAMN04487941_2943 [Pontibacter akesuensis]